jgi:hypothetical protein
VVKLETGVDDELQVFKSLWWKILDESKFKTFSNTKDLKKRDIKDFRRGLSPSKVCRCTAYTTIVVG